MSEHKRNPDELLTQLQRAVVARLNEPHPKLSLPVLPERADRLLGVLGDNVRKNGVIGGLRSKSS